MIEVYSDISVCMTRRAAFCFCYVDRLVADFRFGLFPDNYPHGRAVHLEIQSLCFALEARPELKEVTLHTDIADVPIIIEKGIDKYAAGQQNYGSIGRLVDHTLTRKINIVITNRQSKDLDKKLYNICHVVSNRYASGATADNVIHYIKTRHFNAINVAELDPMVDLVVALPTP